jgi:hypothetical protein
MHLELVDVGDGGVVGGLGVDTGDTVGSEGLVAGHGWVESYLILPLPTDFLVAADECGGEQESSSEGAVPVAGLVEDGVVGGRGLGSHGKIIDSMSDV